MKFRNPVRKFPVKVIIWEKRAGTVIPRWDRARRFKTKDGEYYYELAKTKKDTKPIRYDYVYPCGKGLLLNLYSPSPYEYHPIKFSEVEKNLVPSVDPFYINWLVNENKKAVIKWRKKSTWDVLLPIIPVAIVVIISGLVLAITTEKFTEMAGSLGNIAYHLGVVSEDLVEAIRTITPEYKVEGAAPTTTPPG